MAAFTSPLTSNSQIYPLGLEFECFNCPISDEPMENPVMCPCCNVTYERAELLKCIPKEVKQIGKIQCPTSRQVFDVQQIRPNHALRYAKEEVSQKIKAVIEAVVKTKVNEETADLAAQFKQDLAKTIQELNSQNQTNRLSLAATFIGGALFTLAIAKFKN